MSSHSSPLFPDAGALQGAEALRLYQVHCTPHELLMTARRCMLVCPIFYKDMQHVIPQ